ncbi:MAG: tetratricopeptide repeat protein [Candidatus Sumerlaeia bacterium]
MRLLSFALAVMLFSGSALAADSMSDVSPAALLRADQFDKLEAFYDFYFKSYDPKVPNSYLPVETALNRIPYMADLLPHLDKWIEARPHSHAAYAVRGGFYISHAWAARGTGWANSVSPKGWEAFHERLALAENDLTSATRLNPGSPFPYPDLITIDMAMSRPLNASATRLVKARTIDPSYYPAYARFLNLNRPRWGGSHETMLTFVKNNADKIPGSNLPLLWIDYHGEMCSQQGEGDAWWNDPAHWQQVDEVFRKVIPLQPNPNRLRSDYAAYADWAGKIDVVREQLEILGANWNRGDEGLTQVFVLAREAWPQRDCYKWIAERATADLQKKPDSPRILFLRAMAYRHLKQNDKAMEDLKKAVELNPAMYRAWYQIASVEFGAKRYQQAIAAADQYFLSNPGNGATIELKAQALKGMGLQDQAIAFMKSQLEMYPALPDIYYRLGMMQLDKRDFEGARKTGESGVHWASNFKNDSAGVKLYWLLGSAHSELKHPDEAYKAYTEALKLEKETFMLDVFASLYEAGGQWDAYKARILKDVPAIYHGGKTPAQRTENLARFQEKIKAADNPLKAAQDQLAGDPGDPMTYLNAANNYLKARQTDKAIDAVNEGLKLDAKNTELRVMKGKCLETARRHNEALPIYRQLVAENPAEAGYYDDLSRCLSAMQDYKGALDACEAFFKNCPDAPDKIRSTMFGRRASMRNRVQHGAPATRNNLKDLDEAIRLNPNDPDLYYKAAWQKMNTRDLETALTYARKSIELRPKPWAPAYSQLGVLLNLSGRKQDALEAWNQALKIDPKDSMALSCLKRANKPAAK